MEKGEGLRGGKEEGLKVGKGGRVKGGEKEEGFRIGKRGR